VEVWRRLRMKLTAAAGVWRYQPQRALMRIARQSLLREEAEASHVAEQQQLVMVLGPEVLSRLLEVGVEPQAVPLWRPVLVTLGPGVPRPVAVGPRDVPIPAWLAPLPLSRALHSMRGCPS